MRHITNIGAVITLIGMAAVGGAIENGDSFLKAFALLGTGVLITLIAVGIEKVKAYE